MPAHRTSEYLQRNWSGRFPVFPLAASIQATNWQPLPLFGPQLTFADFGDFVVSTSSELGGGNTPTVTCTVPVAGALVLPTLLDAVTASSCFHTNEPDNKTLLDSIISTVAQHHLITPPTTTPSPQQPPATTPPATAAPTQQPPTTAPTTQQSAAPFAVTSRSPTSGPAGGDTRIVIHGSGFSSVNKVVMNSVRPLPEGDPNYFKQNLHPSFSVISDSEIDVTTPAGAAGLTYEIDFFTRCCEYFTTNFPGIPLFTFK